MPPIEAEGAPRSPTPEGEPAHPRRPFADPLDTPNAVDPRGLLTFGAGGLALLAFAPLMTRDRRLTLVLGVALVALYVLRLTVLDAGNAAVVGLAAVTGFVLSPLWYARLGLALGQYEPRMMVFSPRAGRS